MLRHATTNLPRRRAPAHRPFWHAVFVFQQYIRRLDAESNMTTNAEQSEMLPKGRGEENMKDTEMRGTDTEEKTEALEHEQKLLPDVVFSTDGEDLGDLMEEYQADQSPLPFHSPAVDEGRAASPSAATVAVPASPPSDTAEFPPCPLPSLRTVCDEVFRGLPSVELGTDLYVGFEGCGEEDDVEGDMARRFLSRLGCGPMGGVAGGVACSIAGGAAGDAEDPDFVDTVSTLSKMKDHNDTKRRAKKRKGAEGPAGESKGAEGLATDAMGAEGLATDAMGAVGLATMGAPNRVARKFKVSRSVTEEQVGLLDMSKIMAYIGRIQQDPGPFEVKTEDKNGKPGNLYVVDEKKTKMLLMASALHGTLDRDIQNLRAVLHNAVIKHSHVYCSCDLSDAPNLQGRKCLKRHRAGAGFCRN